MKYIIGGFGLNDKHNIEQHVLSVTWQAFDRVRASSARGKEFEQNVII